VRSGDESASRARSEPQASGVHQAGAIRAFFAIELSDPARRAAAELAAALRARPGGDAVSWVRPEAMHVTLRFLGNIASAQVEPLLAQVRAQSRALTPFALRLGAPGCLPSARRPRVLLLELEPQAPLTALAAAVERGVVAAGCAPETRAFRGHLTLGRVKERGRPPSLDGLSAEPALFDVTESVLLASELHPSGSRYTPLGLVPLGASGGSLSSSHHP
jgi:2'-5' RNA ligase